MANYDSEIISLVKNEKKNYEDASADIRRAIKRARKNYAGKFDKPYTKRGREKLFIPVTQWEVDTIVPKIFVNDKALTVNPRNEQSVRKAFIAEQVMKYQIRETNFPTYFRNSIYDLGIDGTTVWAMYWDFEREIIPEDSKLSKKALKFFKRLFNGKVERETPEINVLKDNIGFKQINVLDCYIDPTADSIEEAESFTYKRVEAVEKVKRNKLYRNTDDIVGFNVEPQDTYSSQSTNQYNIGKSDVTHEQKQIDIYERWGRIPLHFLTNKRKDEKKGIMIDGVITVAGIDSGTPTVLRVDVNPFEHGAKPFVECWYQKKQGRWYGIGIGERTIGLQSYMNRTVNRRIENEDLLHSGMFLKKRGSGISTKNITAYPGAVIEVDNMDDIQQLQIRDISQLSTGTVTLINQMIERVNGANEIAVGSAADRSATTSLIKDRNADTRFAAVRGYINDFLLRFFTQWEALNRQFIDTDFTIRLTGEDIDFQEIDEMLGITPEQSAQSPNFRFIEGEPETLNGEFDLEVDIDQSIPMNKQENAQRILQAITTAAQIGLPAPFVEMFNAYLDNIGLRGAKFKIQRNQMQMAPMQQGGPGTPPSPPPSELDQFTEANNVDDALNTVNIPSNVVGR